MQVTFIVPIVTMIMLTLYGLTLDGAYDGIYYLMKPDLRNLINPLVWADAGKLTQFNISIQPSFVDECWLWSAHSVCQS